MITRVLGAGLVTATAAVALVACHEAAVPTAAISLHNCGHTISLDHAPERVVLQSSSPAQTLADLGVLDTVVAKAGYFPPEYFNDDVRAQLDDIETLSDRLNGTGHLEITKEAVMAKQPDLILGANDTVNADSVPDVPVVNEPGYCGEVTDASWQDMYDEVSMYGQLFDVPERAQAVNDELAAQVAALDTAAGAGRSVAVLYPGAEGGTLYAYGANSMSNPVVESVGLHNVFGEVKDRVFEISAEQLVAANPDVIVLLHSGEPNIIDHVRSLPGADAITAVKKDAMLPLGLAFGEPPTPLAVRGAQQVAEFLRAHG